MFLYKKLSHERKDTGRYSVLNIYITDIPKTLHEEIDKIDKYISDKLQPLEREDKENQIELKKLTKEEFLKLIQNKFY